MPALANLGITKTDGVASVNAGASTTYTIVLSNAGPSPANGATLADPVAAGLTKTAVSCSYAGGAIGPLAPTVAQMEAGFAVTTLPNGGSATCSVTATVTATSGSVANTATATVPAGTTDPAPGNNSATDTDTVNPVANLGVVKTQSPASPVAVGSPISYTIVYSNAGPSAANGATFTDPVAANLSVSGVTCASPVGGAACPSVANTTVALMQGAGIVIPTLPSGGSVTFSVSGTVTGTGAISNTATATVPAGTTDPTPGNNSSTAVNGSALVADLGITKTDGVAAVNAGASTTYTIVLSNAGPSPANGATLADPVAAGLTKTAVSCSYAGGAAGPLAPTVAQMEAGFAVTTLPNGGSATCSVTATVTATSGSVANTATATVPAGTTDPVAGNNSATDTDTVNPTVASVGSSTVIEGTPLSHLVTLSAQTTQPVSYAFSLVPGATNPATAGTDYTNAPTFSNGVTLVGANVLVPAGVTTFTVSYPTLVDAVADSGETTALTVGGQTGTGTINDSIALTVTKTASQSPLVVGQTGQFYTITIAVANGPTTAAITLADAMPVGIITNGAVTAVGGILSGCPAIGATNLTGCTIASPTSGPIVIRVPVAVGTAVSGSVVNSATVTGGGDPSCPAAVHCTGTVTTTVNRPDMQVVPRTELPPAVKGVPYPAGQTIVCTNASSVPATNATCEVTNLPPGLISTCTPTSPVASLPAGGTIVCTISGTPTTTALINAKVITGADGDTVASNNEGVLVSKPLPGLNVAKTVSVNPLIIGATDQYYSISIAVTNGPTIAPIVLNDKFAPGITSSGPVIITGASFVSGSCSAATQAGATSLTGCSIEAGVTGTIYIKVPILVDGIAEGETGGNNTVVASGGGDPTCPDAANCIGSTGAVAVIYGDLGTLFIRKVVDKVSVEIGDALTYQITVKSTKVTGVATIQDHLPLGFKLISNTVRVTKAGVLVAVSDPVGAPGPDLTFTVQVPAIDQEVMIEYKVRVGLGADRGDGTNQAQASMIRGRLRSMIAKAKVKVTGGVFTREACIVGKVYADCNGNAMQDKGEPGIPGVSLFLEDGTSMTTDENGLYSICGVRAITHVLKVDGKTLPDGSALGITSNRNAGDPNSLFVDVLAGQLHNTEFRVESCSPQVQQQIQMRQKGQGPGAPAKAAPSPGGGVQFDSSKPNISGSGLNRTTPKAVEAGSKS